MFIKSAEPTTDINTNSLIDLKLHNKRIKFCCEPFSIKCTDVNTDVTIDFGLNKKNAFSYFKCFEDKHRLRRRTNLNPNSDSIISYSPTKVRSYYSNGDLLEISLFSDDPFHTESKLTLKWLESECLNVVFNVDNNTNIKSTSMVFTHSGLANEAIWGAGERFNGVNLLGKKIKIAVEEGGKGIRNWSYCPIPFFVSSFGYGVYFQSHFNHDFDFYSCSDGESKSPAITVKSYSTSLSAVFIFNKSPLDVISIFCKSTSLPSIPPQWVFGNIRNINGGDAAVLSEAKRIRDNNIPCSGIWYYDSLDRDNNIGWPINPNFFDNYYQDLSKVNANLHSMKFKTQTYFFPYFYSDTKSFSEGEKKGFFIKNSANQPYLILHCAIDSHNKEMILKPAALLDFTNPEAIKWLASIITSILKDLDFDGWMQDFGEDAPADGMYFDQVSGIINSNRYPYLYHKEIYNIAVKIKNDVGFYARSGSLGSNSYVPFMWTGDQTCSWDKEEGLSTVLSAVLSLGMSGFPVVGPDIAGFFNYKERPGISDEELWIRWLQMCSLFPVMRDLHAFSQVDIWTSDLTIKMYKQYAQLHVQLFPIFYAAAKEAHKTGKPIIRHLFHNYPNERDLLFVEDQFMVSNKILVAPVLVKGAVQRDIVFPAGYWIDWWSGEMIKGGKVYSVPVSLEKIPIYVKNMECITTLSMSVNSLFDNEKLRNDLELHIYNYDLSNWQDSDTAIPDICRGSIYQDTTYTWSIHKKTLNIKGLSSGAIRVYFHAEDYIKTVTICKDGLYAF